MMKNILVAILITVSFAAFGQQPERTSDMEINARIKAVSDQRNWMSDEAAYWKAKAVVFEADAAAAKKELADLKEKNKACEKK